VAVTTDIGRDGALHAEQKLTQVFWRNTLPTFKDSESLRALTGSAFCHQRIAAYLNRGILRQCEQLSCYFFIAAIDDSDPGLYLRCGSTKRLAIADMGRLHQGHTTCARNGIDPRASTGGRTAQKNDGNCSTTVDFHHSFLLRGGVNIFQEDNTDPSIARKLLNESLAWNQFVLLKKQLFLRAKANYFPHCLSSKHLLE
jgi:hypothetical protein